MSGNTDCPECGGYGWRVPENAPDHRDPAYRQPCPDCICPECGRHTTAGEVCAASCGAERAA